jgi:Bacterial PH domain
MRQEVGMTGQPRYDTYTVSSTVLRRFWLVMGLGTALLLCQVSADDTWGPTGKFLTIACYFVLMGLLVTWVYRSATVTSPQHLTVRGPFRTRRIPWPQVQAIMIEINPGSLGSADAPQLIAVAYDAAGRRIPLPHLNEKSFANRYGSLESEVDGIRAAWLAGRGQGWAPVAHAQARAAEIAKHGIDSWMLGLSLASLSILGVAIVFAVGLIAGVRAPWPLSLIFLPQALLVIPAVVFFVSTFASMISRRRARTRVRRQQPLPETPQPPA